MKYLFIASALILSLVFSASSVLAASANATIPGATSTFSSAAEYGAQFTAKNNITIEGAIKFTGDGAETCRIALVNGPILATGASFSGTYCAFNQTVEIDADTYFAIVADSSGSTTVHYHNANALPYDMNIVWLNGSGGVTGPVDTSQNTRRIYGFQYFNTTLPGVPLITAELFNNVTGASIGTTTFSNVTGILTFNYFNITDSGFCVTYTGNGTGTNCTSSGSGSSTFFNVSIEENVTESATVIADSFQAILEMQASQLFTLNTITVFNGSNNATTNTTSSGTLYLKALNGSNNVQIDVAGNFSQNVSCTVPTPLQTVSCNATGIHDNFYSFNATDIWNNQAILNFTLTITNSSLGGLPNTTNTTTGLINFSLLQGYDYFVQFTTENGTWEYTNVTLAPNASNQHYEFQVLPAPSIDITIRDASTGSLITQNITIVLTSNTTGDTVYTATGGYFATDLSPQQYTIKLSNANYSQSTYVVTATTGSVYFLTAYLQAVNTSDVVMQFVDSIASTVTISGTQVSQQTLVNGTWQTISSKLTDITGRTVFGYVDDVAYRFIAVATGYQAKEFTLDPVLFNTYTVKMTRTTSLETDEDFQSVYMDYTPKVFYDGQQNQVNITFNSPLGTFTSYSYALTYPGGSDSGNGTNIVGETFTVNFNITGASYLDRVNISLTYDTSIGAPRMFNYSNLILINPGNTTFIANQDNTFGLGLLERLIIGTAVIVVVAGLVTLGAGPLWGLGMALFLMGVWIYTVFWPWWAAGLSFLVGFALVAGRSD